MRTLITLGSLFLVHISSIIWFAALEDYCLNSGYSWTFSKLIAYVLVALTGLILAILLWKKTTKWKRIFRIVTFVLILFGGFGAAFALNPIYEGDFSSEGTQLANEPALFDEKTNLVMLALPDCPFCHESVQTLNLLQKRNPSLKIEIQVLTKDTIRIEMLRNLATKKINVHTTEDLNEMGRFGKDGYPTFLLVNNGKPTYLWNNSQLGAGALDKVEAQVQSR